MNEFEDVRGVRSKEEPFPASPTSAVSVTEGNRLKILLALRRNCSKAWRGAATFEMGTLTAEDPSVPAI